jgi:uncharacterized protein YuzE
VKLRYYPETDSLYVELRSAPGAATLMVTEGLNVDVDEHGDPVGFDIEAASQRLDLTTVEAVALPLLSIRLG